MSRPGVVVRDPHPPRRRGRQRGAIAVAVRDGGQQIDAGKALERVRHRQQLGLGKRIGDPAAKRKSPDAGRLRGMRNDDDAVVHHGVIGCFGAVPFQHGEFRQMQVAALAVAEHPREIENLRSRPPPAVSCRRIPARSADSAWRARRRHAMSSVRGACRWVSLPGETCKIPVSTSAKPCSSNHAAQRPW